MKNTPSPSPLKEPPWYVETIGLPYDGPVLDQNDLSDLMNELGDGEEYLEAAGPADPDYRPTFVYGPYTEQQAKRLADWLNQPEVSTKEKITGATASPMIRYYPLGTYE